MELDQVSSQPAFRSQAAHTSCVFSTPSLTHVAGCPRFERHSETEPVEGLADSQPRSHLLWDKNSLERQAESLRPFVISAPPLLSRPTAPDTLHAAQVPGEDETCPKTLRPGCKARIRHLRFPGDPGFLGLYPDHSNLLPETDRKYSSRPSRFPVYRICKEEI